MAVILPPNGSLSAGHEPGADEFEGILKLLNNLVTSGTLDCSSTLNITTAEQDVPGCSANVAVSGSHGFVFVYGSFDFRATALGTSVNLAGRCSVGGVTQPGDANLFITTANTRASVSRMWKASVGSGVTNVKLRALASSGTPSSATAGNPHTSMTVIVFDIP